MKPQQNNSRHCVCVYLSRYVQFLRSAAMSSWRYNCRVYRVGGGRVCCWPVSLLSAASWSRSAPGAGPSTPAAVSSTLHALSPASVQVRHPALCPPRPRRSAASVAAPQGIHQAEWLQWWWSAYRDAIDRWGRYCRHATPD